MKLSRIWTECSKCADGVARPVTRMGDAYYCDEHRPEPEPVSSDVVGIDSRLAGTRHPDKGGTAEAMAELNLARERAMKELGP